MKDRKFPDQNHECDYLLTNKLTVVAVTDLVFYGMLFGPGFTGENGKVRKRKMGEERKKKGTGVVLRWDRGARPPRFTCCLLQIQKLAGKKFQAI